MHSSSVVNAYFMTTSGRISEGRWGSSRWKGKDDEMDSDSADWNAAQSWPCIVSVHQAIRAQVWDGAGLGMVVGDNCSCRGRWSDCRRNSKAENDIDCTSEGELDIARSNTLFPWVAIIDVCEYTLLRMSPINSFVINVANRCEQLEVVNDGFQSGCIRLKSPTRRIGSCDDCADLMELISDSMACVVTVGWRYTVPRRNGCVEGEEVSVDYWIGQCTRCTQYNSYTSFDKKNKIEMSCRQKELLLNSIDCLVDVLLASSGWNDSQVQNSRLILITHKDRSDSKREDEKTNANTQDNTTTYASACTYLITHEDRSDSKSDDKQMIGKENIGRE